MKKNECVREKVEEKQKEAYIILMSQERRGSTQTQLSRTHTHTL